MWNLGWRCYDIRNEKSRAQKTSSQCRRLWRWRQRPHLEWWFTNLHHVTLQTYLHHCPCNSLTCNTRLNSKVQQDKHKWNLRERDHLGDPGIDGRITLRRIFRKWDVGGMDWTELAQDRDRWRALVDAVMNLRVP